MDSSSPSPDDEDFFSRIPDEILEFVLFLSSPYGDLRSARAVSRRFRRCAARVITRKERQFCWAVPLMSLAWQNLDVANDSQGSVISKRYSHSSCYHDATLSMYVFGGCTSTSTTFNDLWRLDLTTRTWTRPVATGTYPSPKACAVMVLHSSANCLLLFGGWTHPSLYPLHQSWRLFNELHQYDLGSNRWTHVLPASSLKPPAMAGHSATVHFETNMVVFGGLQKQRSNIGQFSSSNDVWCFNLVTRQWHQRDIPEPRPSPRYGQSQLKLDDNHILILGGCGGPNNIFTDAWLLMMESPHWRWVKCQIKNAGLYGAGHMWCHPAVKVENYAVILGKNRQLPQRPAGEKDPLVNDTTQFNVIPQLRRGINRGYGTIRRQNTSERHQQDRSRTASMDEDEDAPTLSVEPVLESRSRAELSQQVSTEQVFKTSVTLNVNPGEQRQQLRRQSSAPSPSQLSRMSRQSSLPAPEMSRLQAFANAAPATYTSSSRLSLGAIPKNKSNSNVPKKHLETRQRQLETLKRMDERLKTMEESDTSKKEKSSNNRCWSCHQSLGMHVLDLSLALEDEHVLTWLEVMPLEGHAPEETILYTLVKGRAELIMFGGIQKDVSAMTARQPQTIESVSNSLYFLSPPSSVV